MSQALVLPFTRISRHSLAFTRIGPFRMPQLRVEEHAHYRRVVAPAYPPYDSSVPLEVLEDTTVRHLILGPLALLLQAYGDRPVSLDSPDYPVFSTPRVSPVSVLFSVNNGMLTLSYRHVTPGNVEKTLTSYLGVQVVISE